MRILYITGGFPEEGTKVGDPFIVNRIKILEKNGIKCDVYGRRFVDGFFRAILKKILGRKPWSRLAEPSTNFQGQEFNAYEVPVGLLEDLFGINKSRFSERSIQKALYDKISGNDYDLVHAHWGYPEGIVGLNIAHKLKIPFVLTVHGSDIHTNPFTNPGIKKRTILALNNANAVIFVSQSLRTIATSMGYSATNSFVVPNGVDIELFKHSNKNDAKKAKGLESRKTIIGFIGNLIEAKGSDLLAPIFKIIHEKKPDVAFLIIGDGELRQRIENECKEYDLDVIFTGYIFPDQVPSYLNCMDVLLMPSRKEGWGCVAVESRACGVPIVATDAGALKESVSSGGIVLNIDNELTRKMADSALYLIDNPMDPDIIVNDARELDWNNTVKKEMTIYDLVTSRP